MLDIRHGVHLLETSDLDAFLALTAVNPVVNVFAEYRARTTKLDPRWLGGEIWGRFHDGRLSAACHVGANLVPVQADPRDAVAFAERALARRRSVATLVGPHDAIEAFWSVVSEDWGQPREFRWKQPHLEIDRAPAVDPDPEVRRTTRADLDVLYPACVAMYAEEVGVSPEFGGGGALYRARVLQLISRGWSFARFEEGRVVFKADVACVTPYSAQIQGVYVPPDLRGQGLATRGMAAVAALVLADLAPVASLYVNEWNEPARRAYERVGFRETARFSTIMF